MNPQTSTVSVSPKGNMLLGLVVVVLMAHDFPFPSRNFTFICPNVPQFILVIMAANLLYGLLSGLLLVSNFVLKFDPIFLLIFMLINFYYHMLSKNFSC